MPNLFSQTDISLGKSHRSISIKTVLTNEKNIDIDVQHVWQYLLKHAGQVKAIF